MRCHPAETLAVIADLRVMNPLPAREIFPGNGHYTRSARVERVPVTPLYTPLFTVGVVHRWWVSI